MRKFKIPTFTQGTTNKTIRFPNDLIEDIEKELVYKNCSFTAFIIAAVRFALENKDNQMNHN